MATLTFTGSFATLDESAGLQNSTATPAVSGDSNDNDIAAASLPAALAGLGTPLDAALSGYTGAGTGATVFTITGAVDDMAFTTASGAPFNGTQSSGLYTVNGDEIFLFSGTDNNVLLGKTAGGTLVFSAYLQEIGSPVTGAKIWLVEYVPIRHNLDGASPDDAVDLTEKVWVTLSSSLDFSLTNAPSGQSLFLMMGDTDASGTGILITGRKPADQSTGANVTTGDTVNSSQGGGSTTLGTNNQMIDRGEGMYFTFVTGVNPDLTIPNLEPGEAGTESNIQFTGLLPADTATVHIAQLQKGKAATVTLTAFNAVNEDGVDYVHADGLHNTSTVAIDSVIVRNAAGVVVNDVTINIVNGVATITGVKAGYSIEYHTAADHTRVLVENTGSKGSASFDIGGFNLTNNTSTTEEIGSRMVFEDSGPAITEGTDPPALTVDDSTLGTDHSLSFASAFTTSFGTDGGATGSPTYALGISASGAATDLYETSSGHRVFLFLNNGVVEGREGTTALDAVGGDIVFEVSVDSSGVVKLDQKSAVIHDDDEDPDESGSPAQLGDAELITLTATVTDKDNDEQSLTIDIGDLLNFEDDGPSITLATPTDTVVLNTQDGDTEGADTDSATLDFSGAFSVSTSSYGNDGAGDTTWSYALSVDAADSALKSHGNTIYLYLVGGVVIGSTAALVGDITAENKVFDVSVSAAGVVTLRQYAQVDHELPGATSNFSSQQAVLADVKISLTGTAVITDRDGDFVSASKVLDLGANIKFDDDGPSGFTPDGASLVNTGTASATENLNAGNDAADVIGADQLGTAWFIDGKVEDNYLYADDGITLLKSGGANIVLSGFNTGTLVAKTEGTNLTVFTATLIPGTDQYTIDFDLPIDDGSVATSLLGAAPVRSGNPTYNIIDDVGDTTLDLLFSGGDTDGGLPADHSVNVSTTGAGVDNQSMNADDGVGETLRIDFATDIALSGSPNGSDFTSTIVGFPTVINHTTVNDFAFLVSQNTPSGTTATVLVMAYDADNDKLLTGDTGVGHDVIDPITMVKVNDTVIYDNGTVTPTVINGKTVTAIAYGDGVIITGLNEGATGDGTGGDDPMITVTTADGFNRVEVSNFSGQTVNDVLLGGTDFDLAPAGVFQGTLGDEVNFSLPVQMTDFDGDLGPVAYIGVELTPVPL